MFSQNSQPPDDELNKNILNNPRRRRKKSLKNKNKRKGIKKKSTGRNQPTQSAFTTITMSSWAESFTHAATWQLKQQIAYWKSKATALQYENQLLHDIIRKNYARDSQSDSKIHKNSDSEIISENAESSSSSEEEDENNAELEVSEEFIQFLMDNAKYKEDAKRERERLKALHNAEQDLVKEMEVMPVKSAENSEEILKELYGEKWQRISALETSLQSEFLNNCDKEKPEYWPNIPLNFNFN